MPWPRSDAPEKMAPMPAAQRLEKSLRIVERGRGGAPRRRSASPSAHCPMSRGPAQQPQRRAPHDRRGRPRPVSCGGHASATSAALVSRSIGLRSEAANTPVRAQATSIADRPVDVSLSPQSSAARRLSTSASSLCSHGDHVRADQWPLGGTGEIEEIGEVGSPRRIGFASIDQPVAGVLADGLEQSVARRLTVVDLDQRAVDQTR